MSCAIITYTAAQLLVLNGQRRTEGAKERLASSRRTPRRQAGGGDTVCRRAQQITPVLLGKKVARSDHHSARGTAVTQRPRTTTPSRPVSGISATHNVPTTARHALPRGGGAASRTVASRPVTAHPPRITPPPGMVCMQDLEAQRTRDIAEQIRLDTVAAVCGDHAKRPVSRMLSETGQRCAREAELLLQRLDRMTLPFKFPVVFVPQKAALVSGHAGKPRQWRR